MIIGISMDLETCLILGQVSHKLLYSMKKLLTEIWSGVRWAGGSPNSDRVAHAGGEG